MKSYPSIETKFVKDIPLFFFDKLDGSNIRAEWNKKKGFYKYGSRTQLIDVNSPIFGESIHLINEKYSDDLSKRFVDNKYESAVGFFEFYGKSSFAGSHSENEPHTVTLFDIDVYKKGLLPPEQFLKVTDGLDIAPLLYTGLVTEELFDQVRAGTFPGMTFEGVVAKGVVKNQVKMCKIKTLQWLEKLRTYCGGNEQLFERLK